MRTVLLAFMLALAMAAKAQVGGQSFEQMKEKYKSASAEERARMDEQYRDVEAKLKAQQVTNIGGVAFGTPREKALAMLRNKYGASEYNQENDIVSFRDIKYAGYGFDAVHFLFQSDGVNSYFYSCIFIKEAKTQQEAVSGQQMLNKVLSEKYELYKVTTEKGFDTYGGGVSPLWDGHWYNMSDNFYTALHTDIMQYEPELVKIFGNQCAVRLIYGPYNYVKEEF